MQLLVDEWSRSRRTLAWTNGRFQTEYTVQSQPWCANGHAPLTTQQADLLGRAQRRASTAPRATSARARWDSTRPPGAARTVRIALARRGGAPAEPVSLELAYVYVGDDYPILRLPASVPTEASVIRWRAAAGELPFCDR